MATIHFTPNLTRQTTAPSVHAPGGTLRSVLDTAFSALPTLRSYILDDQGAIRKHITIFIDGAPILDRTTLRDPVGENSELYVMQALSGG